MTEQEAREFAAQVEKMFPGLRTFVEHAKGQFIPKDSPRVQSYDYWGVWATREDVERWWEAKDLIGLGSYTLDRLQKMAHILGAPVVEQQEVG